MNVIDRARDLIERDGWMQMTDSEVAPRSACISIAILRVCTGEDGINNKEHNSALGAVEAELGVPCIDGIWDFNDDPSTSLEDVLLVMRRASARLDGETR